MKSHLGHIDRRFGAISTGAPQQTTTTHRTLERPLLPVHTVANMPPFLRSQSADDVATAGASKASSKMARVFRSTSCLEIGSKTMVTAQTAVLSKSLWMGLLDRIIHYFGGTTKRDRIERNLSIVCAPPDDSSCSEEHPDVRRLQAFATLKRMAKPEHQRRFALDLFVEPRTVNGERISVLRYSLGIDGVKLASADIGEPSLDACVAFNSLADWVGLQSPTGRRLQGREYLLTVREALRHHDMPQDREVQNEVGNIRRALPQGASAMDEASAAPDTVNLLARQSLAMAAICRQQGVAIEFTSEQRNGNLVQSADLVVTAGGVFGAADRRPRSQFPLVTASKRVADLPPGFIQEGLSAAFAIRCGNLLEKNRDCLAEVKDLCQMRAESACDDPASLAKLQAVLMADVDPTADKFLRMPPLEDGESSMKVYIGDDEHPDEYIFSARVPTNGEFRGAILRAEIAKRYVSLSELFSRDYLGATDTRLQAIVGAVWAQTVACLADFLSDEDRRGIVDRITVVPVGKTTAGAMLQRDFGKFLKPAQDKGA